MVEDSEVEYAATALVPVLHVLTAAPSVAHGAMGFGATVASLQHVSQIFCSCDAAAFFSCLKRTKNALEGLKAIVVLFEAVCFSVGTNHVGNLSYPQWCHVVH